MSADRLRATPLVAAWEAWVATLMLAGSPAAPIAVDAPHLLGLTIFSPGGEPARIRLRETKSRLAQRAAHLPEPEPA